MAFLRLKVIRKIQGAKVVCFGDSITLGYGVPVAQTWVNQLRTDSAWTW
jgi:lysophospholipase L1-like esterase